MALIPTKRELGPLDQLAIRPQYTPARDFSGAALQNAGQALASVGQDVSAIAKDRQQTEKQVIGYDSAARYKLWEDQQQERANEAIRSAQPGAAGLVDTFGASFEKEKTAFLDTLPAELRPRYEPVMAGAQGNLLGRVRQFETEERTRFEGANLDQIVDRQILKAASNPNDPTQIARTRKDAEDFIKANPYLTPVQKDERLRKVPDQFAIGVGNAVNADPAANAAIFDTGGVDTDIPPEGKALLNTISGPESGGRYDVRFDGGSGSTITDFSDHPRVAARIPGGFAAAGKTSSAAGRYQFVAGTWDRAAAAVGAKDFSPANQDKAAWWLAQSDYKRNTGRELLADLQSKDPIVLSGVRRGLAGTWEGLARLGDKSFVDRLSGASTSIPTAGTGPGGSGAPSMAKSQAYWTRQAPDASSDVIQKLAEQSVNSRTRYLQEEATSRTALAGQTVDTFNLRIATGDESLVQNDIVTSQAIDDGQKAALINTLTAKRKEQQETSDFIRALTSTDTPLNPFDADTQKMVDRSYDAMVKAQPEQAEAIANEIVRRGAIPKAVSNSVRNDVYSSDPETVASALDRAGRLKAQAPAAFDAMPGNAELSKDTVSFQHMVNDRGFSADDAAKRLIERRSSTFKVDEAVLGAAADKAVKDLRPGEIVGEFDDGSIFTSPGLGADTSTQNALTLDYREAYREAFVRSGGDADEAKRLAIADLRKVWGVSSVSGDAQMMKYPPEQFYPKIDGGHDYVRDEYLSAAKEIEGEDTENVVLLPNAKTAADIRRGRLPSYTVLVIKTVDGQTVRNQLLESVAIDPAKISARAKATEQKTLQEAVEYRDLQSDMKSGLDRQDAMDSYLGMQGVPRPVTTTAPQPASAGASRAALPRSTKTTSAPQPRRIIKSETPDRGNDGYVGLDDGASIPEKR